MILLPGSLSFVMSSAPAKSAGMPDTRPKIHSFILAINVLSNLDSNP